MPYLEFTEKKKSQNTYVQKIFIYIIFSDNHTQINYRAHLIIKRNERTLKYLLYMFSHDIFFCIINYIFLIICILFLIHLPDSIIFKTKSNIFFAKMNGKLQLNYELLFIFFIKEFIIFFSTGQK